MLEPAWNLRFTRTEMQDKRNAARRTLPIPKLKIQNADEEVSLVDSKTWDINDRSCNDSRYKLRNIITTERSSEEKET